MKRYIRSSEVHEADIKQYLKQLKSNGVDLTKHRYELYAQEPHYISFGETYTYRFTSPGDYVAYFAMKLHKEFSSKEVADWLSYYDEESGENEFIAKHPTVSRIKDYASENWWGDGDDIILKLTNLDTGKILYEGDSGDSYEEEEDSWDF